MAKFTFTFTDGTQSNHDTLEGMVEMLLPELNEEDVKTQTESFEKGEWSEDEMIQFIEMFDVQVVKNLSIEVENTYYDEIELVEDFTSIAECENHFMEECERRAEEIARAEMDDNWDEYYDSYEKALEATKEGIAQSLFEEYNFTVLD